MSPRVRLEAVRRVGFPLRRAVADRPFTSPPSPTNIGTSSVRPLAAIACSARARETFAPRSTSWEAEF